MHQISHFFIRISYSYTLHFTGINCIFELQKMIGICAATIALARPKNKFLLHSYRHSAVAFGGLFCTQAQNVQIFPFSFKAMCVAPVQPTYNLKKYRFNEYLMILLYNELEIDLDLPAMDICYDRSLGSLISLKMKCYCESQQILPVPITMMLVAKL